MKNVLPRGDICVHPVLRLYLKNHPHFFERFSFALRPFLAATRQQYRSKIAAMKVVTRQATDMIP